ncbi:MAG: hypothetical protein ACYCXA_00700 [Actinomycetes bacterium]
MRPCLRPGVRVLWRASDTVQLTTEGTHPLVLTGLDRAGSAVLVALDGSLSESALRDLACQHGGPPSRADEVLAALRQAGGLDDASLTEQAWARLPAWSRQRLGPDVAALSARTRGPQPAAEVIAARLNRTVHVVGAGRVGAAVAAALAGSAVGTVTVTDDETSSPADLPAIGWPDPLPGEHRDAMVRRRIAETTPGTRVDGDSAPADVVVLAGPGRWRAGIASGLVRTLMRQRTPHLYVDAGAATGTVGPLVLPGSSPCARCLDLHRCDRDPGFALVAAQLVDQRQRPHPVTEPPCDGVLALLASALAAAQVLAWLDSLVPRSPTPRSPTPRSPTQAGTLPASVGATLEVSLPDGFMRRRGWSRHPGCGCGWDDPTL